MGVWTRTLTLTERNSLRMARRPLFLLIPLTMLTTLVMTKSSVKLDQGEAGERVLTASCKDGADFCEDPADYPVQLINHVMDKKRLKREIPRRPRQASPALNEPVCEMSRYWTRPRAARNNAGKILFILNMNGTETRQEYVQEVEVGECVSTGSTCGDGSVWPNLDTFCKQMYADTMLWAMTGTGEVVIDTFTFPSSCACWGRL